MELKFCILDLSTLVYTTFFNLSVYAHLHFPQHIFNSCFTENKRSSLDAFLRASGVLKCALNSVMTQMSDDLM